MEACNKVLEMDPNHYDALCDRANAYLKNDQFDEGKWYCCTYLFLRIPNAKKNWWLIIWHYYTFDMPEWCEQFRQLDLNRFCLYACAAINDYKQASNINGEFNRAKEGLDKAQKLKKQSEKRDYYKILGVKRYDDVICDKNWF
jgi:hypothetical protein